MIGAVRGYLMKDEVFEYFEARGFPFSVLKKRNRDIKPSHIKAGMVDVYRRRDEFEGYQLGRAALRAAKAIDAREEYEQDLKLNQAVRELEVVKHDFDIEKDYAENLKGIVVVTWLLIITVVITMTVCIWFPEILEFFK